MDHWDPDLINRVALQRPIILFDNAGVGKSSGEIAENFKGWAAHVVKFLDAIKVDQLDLLGFSMGGMAAQMTALAIPHKIRKLVLAGTGPSWNEGAEQGPDEAIRLLARPDQTPKENWKKTFFILSPEKQAVGDLWWDRINERTEATSGEERSLYVPKHKMKAQLKSVTAFLDPSKAADGSYNRLRELKMPVFVANGNNDVLIPTSRSWELFKKLPNAHMHLYPDSGHGFCFEYSELFSKHLALFLDDKRTSKL